MDGKFVVHRRISCSAGVTAWAGSEVPRDLLLSAGGVASKATEILLEVCLVYLVVSHSAGSRDEARPLARTAG